MMWGDYGGAGWGWMALGMGLFWLLVIVLVGAVLYTLSGGPHGRTERRPEARDARALLDERLARSELDVEEYQARCRALDDAGR